MPFDSTAAYGVVQTSSGKTYYVQAGVTYNTTFGVVTGPLDEFPPSVATNVENFNVSGTAVMVNGNTIFSASGDILITQLYSKCITANNATASTLQYSITPTGLVATTISGASASLANAIVGQTVSLDGTALATAATVAANGVTLAAARPIIMLAGALTIVIGVGSTTGTWRHYIRWKPLEIGAVVS